MSPQKNKKLKFNPFGIFMTYVFSGMYKNSGNVLQKNMCSAEENHTGLEWHNFDILGEL